MGGGGNPAIYGNSTNIYLSLIAYKGGDKHRIYGSATKEVQNAMKAHDDGISA
jgi:hypothetical protein